uniref:Methyltransferase domain-containing protein n=1 Tax=Globisporangium ultimum (strain ATCC 200006 / CBS 805.95 / DAOM BR144) TaxID=431595 RepID=K3WLR4_GLOUD
MDIGTTSIASVHTTQPSADTANAPPVAIAPTIAPADSVSWVKNVQRRSGFWGNAYWYDLQLERRMPLAKPMLNEMIAALPPCDGKRAIDLCAGSGRASAALLAAYPTAVVTLVDSSSERLGIAQKRLMDSGVAVGTNAHFVTKSIAPGVSETISGTPVDIVVGCLALHVLAENPAHYQSNMQKGAAVQPAEKPPVETTYELIFRLIYNSLAPGGHLIFADHVGQLGLFAQLQSMAKVGFVDVDCAWRQDDSFVAGGRRPT